MPEDRDHTTVDQAGSDAEANPVTPAQGVGQAGSQGVQPVPAPGHRDSSAGPGVRTAQGASPEDGIHQGDKAPGSDAEANPVTSAQGVGQAGSQGVQPVPAPGHSDSSAGPGVRTAQGASPEDGIHQGDKAPGSDASVTSAGAWTALAAPGHPDGEVDTRP